MEKNDRKCLNILSNHAHEMFEMFVKKRWLKEIDRQLSAVNRSIRKAREANQRVDHERFVLKELVVEYNKIYHDSIIVNGDD